jgi:Protein of unknown function (DUF3261)
MKRLCHATLLALALSGSACVHHTTLSPDVQGERVLLPPSRVPYDFMWRQRVTATWPTGKDSFEAVLQKRGGELVMVGLSPLGLPGFTLTLRDDGSIRVENRMGRALPFEPSYVLADVERVFFPWFDAPPSGAERSGAFGALTLAERFGSDGALLERTFTRTGDAAAGAVHVSYEAGPGAGDAAPRVVLDNAWYRYRLEIETFEQSRL